MYYPKKISVFDLQELNDTEKVLCILLSENKNCMSYVNMLGRTMKEKIKKILYNEDSIV